MDPISEQQPEKSSYNPKIDTDYEIYWLIHKS